jgi:hypothetical protein
MKKHKFKEVLIFVAGGTPQIITETIYGMAHQKPPIEPDEIHIITTTHGRQAIKENLIDSGRFREFCKEFKIKEDILKDDSIVIVRDGKGSPLEDIRRENFKSQWKNGIDLSKLRSDRSKINKDITKNLSNEALAAYYTITSLRKYGGTRFGIKAEKGKIRIE